MRVVVTAGGTREPIDDVRVLANVSTGRLGARVAERLAAAGHRVVLLHARSAEVPTVAGVEGVPFLTSADLAALLEAHVPGADAVVHAAAVADYLPARAEGKLSSDAEELVLRLVRAPKLIDRLRRLAPEAVLVGFKLTSGLDRDERIRVAQRLLTRAGLDLVVCNDTGAIDEHDHHALLVGADGVEAEARGKLAVADAVLKALHGRRADAWGHATS